MSRLDTKSPVPRYYQIYNALLRQIYSGELATGAALPAERNIAEHYGVARLTVVKALDLLIRDGLIDKQQGRGTFVLPKKSSSQMIAYIKAGWPVHQEIDGISEVVLEKGYRLQMLSVDVTFAKLESYIEACIGNGVQGFIIYARAGYEDLSVYKNLLKRGISLVMIDRYYPELSVDRVVYDDEQAAFELTSRLIERGHQRIAIIPGAEVETTAVQNRLAGYRKALRAHNLKLQEELMWFGMYEYPKANSQADQLLCLERIQQSRPTAVLTINDTIYEQLSHDLHSLDHELTRLSEGGFALEAATFSYRMLLCSILKLIALQPGEALGRAAANLLTERLQGRHTKAKHVMIPMNIQELGRNTTRKEAGRKRLLAT
jgi:GntR family transcriptional regulator, arabinose operon transcriptional repressor